MGQSTDAILFYGFTAEEEWEWMEGLEDPYEISDHICALLDGPADPGWNTGDKYKAYKVERDDFIRANFGILFECSSHCSGEYPMPFITTEDLHSRAGRGCPVRADNTTTPQDPAPFLMLAKLLGIEDITVDDIGWHLVSDWS